MGWAPGATRRAEAEIDPKKSQRTSTKTLHRALDSDAAMNRTLLLICVLLLTVDAGADVVTLKDGTRISGEVQSGGQQILIKVGGDSRAVPVDQIESIELGSPALPPAPAPVRPTPGQTPERVTLPAGLEIAARTIDRIDSKKADKFQEYRASLD